jgi:hypothetical protein
LSVIRLSPVDQREGVGEILNPLEMGGIAGDQLQSVRQGIGGDHRIGQAVGWPVRSSSPAIRPASSAVARSKGRTSSTVDFPPGLRSPPVGIGNDLIEEIGILLQGTDGAQNRVG